MQKFGSIDFRALWPFVSNCLILVRVAFRSRLVSFLFYQGHILDFFSSSAGLGDCLNFCQNGKEALSSYDTTIKPYPTTAWPWTTTPTPNPTCKFISYNKDDGLCLAFETCDSVVIDKDHDFVSAEITCPPPTSSKMQKTYNTLEWFVQILFNFR